MADFTAERTFSLLRATRASAARAEWETPRVDPAAGVMEFLSARLRCA